METKERTSCEFLGVHKMGPPTRCDKEISLDYSNREREHMDQTHVIKMNISKRSYGPHNLGVRPVVLP